MERSLEVAIAAGGTAGHINPALALAEELVRRGHHVTFFGQRRRLEGTLVPEAGYDFEEIDVSGFDRSRPWTLLTSVWRTHRAVVDLSRHFAAVGAPDVAVGFGAYVEMPLLKWCGRAGVPYVIHEQNSVPGLANKVFAKGSQAVCVSLPGAKPAFERSLKGGTRLVVTGNPVRSSVVGASRAMGRAAFGIAEDEVMLLVFGGSLGARHLNEAIVGLAGEFADRPALRIVHATGKDLFEEVAASLELPSGLEGRWQVLPYIENMGEALAAADVVVSRAGASSIAEIAALCVPSVLVPYPLATGDHQTTNARYLVDAGAGLLVADADLDGPALRQALLLLLDDAQARERMREAGQALGSHRAASTLADEVEFACA